MNLEDAFLNLHLFVILFTFYIFEIIEFSARNSVNNYKMSKLKSSKHAIAINEQTLASGIVYKNLDAVHSSNYWHKFTVFNTKGYERNFLLKKICDHVYPLDLIPVNYCQNHCNSYFLARNCGPAIEKLCNDNLIIPNHETPSRPLKIQISLKSSTVQEFKIDVQPNITSVLSASFNPVTKRLNLSAFHENRELEEYCPLAQQKIFYFVLHLAKALQPTGVILSHNEIRSLNALEQWAALPITYIDLSYNLIADISELSVLSSFKQITELSVMGNPFCRNFPDEFSYIQIIKEKCPKLQILDGVPIRRNGLPCIHANFLCNLDGFHLVNQFLEHFFTLYDSRSRQNLLNLYHKNALFSLTAQYHSGQLSSSIAQLKTYKIYSRNLKTLADLSRTDSFLYKSNTDIMKIFEKLPPTEHDPFSFTVDLISYTNNSAIIMVTGVFRELAQAFLEVERVLGFCRTFVLESVSGEYCIINDQLHLYNALSHQQTNAFKVSKSVIDTKVPFPETDEQEKQVYETFQAITKLNKEWTDRILDKCEYDIQKSLATFMEMFKVDKIPAEAFQHEEEETSQREELINLL